MVKDPHSNKSQMVIGQLFHQDAYIMSIMSVPVGFQHAMTIPTGAKAFSLQAHEMCCIKSSKLASKK